MLNKPLRLIPILILLLLTAQVKAATGKLSAKNNKYQSGRQFQNGIDSSTYAIEAGAETSFSSQSVLKLPTSQAGTIFLASDYLANLASTAILTGNPSNRAIRPVYFQLLFPFHVFW